jgi:hypothetical protein
MKRYSNSSCGQKRKNSKSGKNEDQPVDSMITSATPTKKLIEIDEEGVFIPIVDSETLYILQNLPPYVEGSRFESPALPIKLMDAPEFSLVLDLDETLVHCSLVELPDANMRFEVEFNDQNCQVSFISLI